MNITLAGLVAHLKQFSTIAGLTVLVSLLGVQQAGEWVSSLAAIVVAAAGLYEIIRPEPVAAPGALPDRTTSD